MKKIILISLVLFCVMGVSCAFGDGIFIVVESYEKAAWRLRWKVKRTQEDILDMEYDEERFGSGGQVSDFL